MDTVMSRPLTLPVPVAPTVTTTPSGPQTATAKARATAGMPPIAPQRFCIICGESPEHLIKPCRTCASDYCGECLDEMFTAAIDDGSRMPPRCCTLLQIHTADLSPATADEYRAKFEEWITLNKTYCPSPACSTFIPERLLSPRESMAPIVSLRSLLIEVFTAVSNSRAARSYRKESANTESGPYRPRLDTIQRHVRAALYSSVDSLTDDMSEIAGDAENYNGPHHPVTTAAEQMLSEYYRELRKVQDKLDLLDAKKTPEDHFPCPKCQIAICVKCKQTEHSGRPCDTTAQDQDMALLERLRCKRCPLCKHAVKKMYGCPHMQCVCGAHWCYYCQRSINECDGACDELAAMEEAEEEYDEDEDEGEDAVMLDVNEVEGSGVPVRESLGQLALPKPSPNDTVPTHPPTHTTSPTAPAATAQPPPPTHPLNPANLDLDAGGARRWAQAPEDFGEEPEEHSYQLWSCPHNFKAFVARDDGYEHGDLGRVECNLCFRRVRVPVFPRDLPLPPPPPSLVKKRGVLERQMTIPVMFAAAVARRKVGLVVGGGAAARAGGAKEEVKERVSMAMECKWCRLVVCESCREKLKASGSRGEAGGGGRLAGHAPARGAELVIL
ncbi:hypothetical protein LTR01_002684 [Friedmanniomyces endolithicus]|nr:hypothetical protein LTR01_002684 [Friedmanniomyces endolithicus]